MSVKCLMVETSDRKRFFLPIACRKMLGEYCRAFGAKIQVVRAELKRSQLAGISSLVSAVCDKSHRTANVKFKAEGQAKPKQRNS